MLSTDLTYLMWMQRLSVLVTCVISTDLSRFVFICIVSSRADEQNEKLAELRALKSEYQTGLWNVNSVMLGGLGKDPDIENTGQ